MCVLLTLTLFQKLCHTLTHPADKEGEEGGESQREKEVRRRGQEASFPKGNGAKAKKKICGSTRDGKGYGNLTASGTELVHSVDHAFIRDV